MGKRPWDWSDFAAGILATLHDPSDATRNPAPSSGKVALNTDYVPGGSNETQGTAAEQPTYVAGAIDGRAVEQFSGSQSFITSLSAGADVRTFFAVISLAALHQDTQTLYGSQGSYGLQWRIEYGGQISFVNQYVAFMGQSDDTVPVSMPVLVVGSYNKTTGTFSFRINGRDAGGSGTSVQNLLAQGSTFGINGTGQNERFSGLAGIRGALNDDTLSNTQLVEGKIAHDGWGITLDAAHPYYVTAPTVDTSGGVIALRRRPMMLLAS